MKIVQRILAVLTALVLGLGAIALPARGALVVSDITATEFSNLISTYDTAWSVLYRGGSTETGTNVEEVRLARNTATPQPGGDADTLIGNLVWSTTNNTVSIAIDGAGNISATANSTIVFELPITRSFNQILMVAYDESNGGFSDLQDIKINGHVVRNMFAQGAGDSAFDVLSVTGFGSQAPFSWNGIWGPGPNPADNDQYVWIIALQNASIPEPSTTSLLMGLVSLLMLRRQR